MGISRKTIIITSAAILLLGGGVAAYWLANKADNPGKEIPSTEDAAMPEETQTEPSDPEDEEANEDGSGAPTPAKAQAEVTMTSPVNGQVFNNETVRVRAFVTGVSEGTCTVIFSKNGQAGVTQSTPVALYTSYYACQGFDIPRANFPAAGEWQVRVAFDSPKAEGSSETRSITIN